jgi:hypothetical protein
MKPVLLPSLLLRLLPSLLLMLLPAVALTLFAAEGVTASAPLHITTSFPSRSISVASFEFGTSVPNTIINLIRGGDIDGEDSDDCAEESDYDEGSDATEEDLSQDELHKEEYDHSLVSPPKVNDQRKKYSPKPMMLPVDDNGRSPGGPSSPGRNRRPYPRRRPSSSSKRRRRSTKHWSTKLASQSLQLTSSLAWNAFVKQPGRLAYHIIRPKHIELAETFGLWRLDQQITLKAKNPRLDDDKIVASVATIELHPGPNRRSGSGGFQPTVIVREIQDDSVYQQQRNQQQTNGQSEGVQQKKQQGQPQEVIVSQTPYTFKKTSPLSGGIGSYKTQFVARAFLTAGGEMRWYGYKGTWQRKIADRSVIKLVGKIYPVHKQRFGKDRGRYVFSGPSIGTFVARRRIRMVKEDDDDDDDDSEYEEADDVDDDDDDGDFSGTAADEDDEEKWDDTDGINEE